jgi:hypothetical protein
MTFLATASGLMIESVRSIAMEKFLSIILKKPAILTRAKGFPMGRKELQALERLGPIQANGPIALI